MAEAFIMGGGYVTSNPSLTISENWQMRVSQDSNSIKSETKTYNLESSPSYITVTSNGTNSFSGIIYSEYMSKFNLPVSVSNGATVTLVGGSQYGQWDQYIYITLSGNQVILTHNARGYTTDIDGNQTGGYSNSTAVLNLFVVGTM